jgi:hypothetical protein
MKRFFVLTAVAVMMAASGAWAVYEVCEGSTAGYCDWKGETGCSAIGIDPGASWSKATCQEAYDNCLDNSSSHTVYSDATCATVKEKGGIESCGEFCQWGDDCWEIQTDPDGVNGTATTTCAEAKTNCDLNGDGRYSGSTSTGTGVTCSGTLVGGGATTKCNFYCKWDTGCYEIKLDPTGANGTPSANCEEAIANCDRDGERYDNATCSGTQVGGEETCGGYCQWESGCEAIKTDKGGQYGPVVSTCVDAISNCDRDGKRYTDAACTVPVSIKYASNPAKVPGLKVSYAKNRVNVNWTPASKISKGTVQLLNVKGVAVSTAFIKANSSKVSVKLGTVGVPAGMYFIHINAVGQDGKKIVTRSAVSIVK